MLESATRPLLCWLERYDTVGMSNDDFNGIASSRPSFSDDDLRRAAKRRLKAKRDFINYLGIWAAVTVFLIVIWFFSGGVGSYFWPIWPFLGMGIGAFFMGLDAYGPGRRYITDSDIDAEIERMRRRSGS